MFGLSIFSTLLGLLSNGLSIATAVPKLIPNPQPDNGRGNAPKTPKGGQQETP
jgi:hypothetical protein